MVSYLTNSWIFWGQIFPEGPKGSASEAELKDRKEALAYELNRSGAYYNMQERLKTSIVRVVKEKFRKSGDMGPEEMKVAKHCTPSCV